MSNASNLSTLANVLDDGSSGQFLKSTGSGGVAFDTVAAGAVVYATADLLPLSGFSAGDMAYVTATNRFYINNGSGWYSISLVNTNPNITSVADASSGTTPFTLATDGTATVITVTAADPEDVPLTYGYSVTSGSLNGSTVAQGTGSNTNVFTVTPHASQDATFTLTFTASDGINQATSANAFSLSFVTIVADSNHTALLATATGTSDNNNITDSSSNSHSITVNGDTHAGTFSPYRSGGYSTSFDGTNDYLQTASSDFYLSTSQFSVEVWINPSSITGNNIILQADQGNDYQLYTTHNSSTSVTKIAWWADQGYMAITDSDMLSVGKWTHFLLTRDSNNTLRIFGNGQLMHVTTNHTHDYGTNNTIFELGYNGSNGFGGEIRDARVISGSIPSEYQTSSTTTGSSVVITVPTEPLTAVSGTKFLGGHLSYLGYTTASATGYFNTIGGNPSTKPFSPYDYEEYSAADHGGSVYFDTSDDYLTVPNGSWKTYGSSNFTIECWFYADRDGMLWGDSSTSGFGDNCTVIAELKEFNGANAWVQVEFRVGSTKYGINPAQGTFKRNAWNHIAFVRNGNTFTVYSNGKDVGNTSQSGSMNTSSNDWAIASGWPSTTGSQFNGYISDFRVSKSARYTAEFTPPTAPLSSTNAELHIKGTDASIIDKSQSTNLNLFGNTTGSTTQVKFSNTKSMYFDGTGDYITIAADEIPDLGAEDWTIETWFYTSNLSANFCILSQGDNGNNLPFSGFRVKSDGGTHTWTYSGGNLVINFHTTAGEVTANTWHHIALTHEYNGSNGGTWRVYINGSKSSVTIGNDTYTSGYYWNSAGVAGKHWEIAKDVYDSNISPAHYLQDFRITKGLARYTASDETANIPSAPLEG